MQRLTRRLGARKKRPESIISTVTSHWDADTRTFQGRESVVTPSSSDLDTMTPGELAILIFHQMPPISQEHVSASWLGGLSSHQHEVLQALMTLFNWRGLNILEALRTLAGHVMLSGEEQQIDRVLAAFSSRWVSANNSHGFKNVEVVHSISYALLILSSALQGSKEDHMSMRAFADSTISAVKNIDLSFAPKSASGTRSIIRRPTSKALVDDTRAYSIEDWLKIVRDLLKMFYMSLEEVPFETPSVEPVEPGPDFSSSATKVASYTPTHTAADVPTSLDTLSITSNANFEHNIPTELASKEGPVFFQTFSSSRSSLKHKHKKEWTEAVGVVERGVLNLCSISNRRLSDLDRPVPRKIILSLELAGSIAQIGADAQWSLMLNDADSRLVHFRTGSEHTAEEFVRSCNYWAACLTKPPLSEMVSSAEFGWGGPLELLKGIPPRKGQVSSGGVEGVIVDAKHFHIHEWVPHKHPGLHSGLDPEKQLQYLQNYVVEVDAELTNHNSRLPEILRVYEGLAVFDRVMSNWEARSQFLLKQSVQFSGYCKALEDASRLRREDETKEEIISSYS